MRKTVLSLILCGFALMAISCENNQGGAASSIEEPYILSVDKQTIEADGSDTATFTITDANGVVLTDAEHISDASFYIVENDSYLTRRTNTFASIDNGTYTIEGMYLGKKCEAPVTVTVANRSKYELFSKKVAIYRLTATWCVYCPQMTVAMENIDDYTKAHSEVMAFHADESFGLKIGGNYLADLLLAQFSMTGYPSAIYSLSYASGDRTRNGIMELIMDELFTHPAATGIKASSEIKDGAVYVTPSVKASKAGTYDLGCALLCDNLYGTSSSYEDIYHNVVTNITGNFRYMSDNAFSLEAGQEKTDIVLNEGKGITFETSRKNDYRIVLFTLVKEDGSTRIDNCISFKLGESVDYVYNE